jgi:hypothetical protein
MPSGMPRASAACLSRIGKSSLAMSPLAVPAGSASNQLIRLFAMGAHGSTMIQAASLVKLAGLS